MSSARNSKIMESCIRVFKFRIFCQPQNHVGSTTLTVIRQLELLKNIRILQGISLHISNLTGSNETIFYNDQPNFLRRYVVDQSQCDPGLHFYYY